MTDRIPPKTLRRSADLIAAGLASASRAEVERIAKRYAIAVTPDMAELIDWADGSDPIARQFIPDPAELQRLPHESADPIGDNAHAPVAGIVHRYPDRLLLKLLHACPVYCRFCFRREMVGPGKPAMLATGDLDAAIAYIAGRPKVWEVILTGGDPLILSVRRLKDVMTRLAAIAHVRIVRVHSRVPVVDPARISTALVKALKASGKAVYVALHANHPRELTPQARAACARFVDSGIPMLGQTVLLRGVNDDAETLAALMRAFVETRIKPYYLHHGDLAPGTGHFRTTIAEGQTLLRALRGHRSGLCQPTYVLDIPGGSGKSPVGPNYLAHSGVDAEGRERCTIIDYRGQAHDYPPRG